MISRSIRHRLSLMVLSCVCIVWIVAVYSCFRHASREVREWEDARLVEYAMFIARLDRTDLNEFSQSPLNAQIELTRPGRHQSAASDSDRLPRDILFEVLDETGAPLTSNIPRDAANLAAWAETHPLPWSADIDGSAWRLYTLHDGQTGRTIRVMETSNTRSDLASGAARQIVWPLFAALPVLAALLWYAIGRSLRPLEAVSTTIRARDADSLTPLGIVGVPTEVRTLVDAIDRLLSQLRQSIARERAFTSDAAHELKTPLAAIKVQAQVALSATTPDLQRLAMQRVIQGVDRSTRLAEQLLLLARLDEYERVPATTVTTADLVEEAVARHVANARGKGIALSVRQESRRAMHADAVLIGILLDNLLDNAIKYGVPQGHVEVSLFDRGHMQCLAVLDDGPGVAEADLARLTDRFYRGASVQSPGSGLGLSIVERIAHYFNGRLQFGPGLGGRGLAVIIDFPALPEAGTGASAAGVRGEDFEHGAMPPP
ncbi:ATP-binding protein [Paraburkholderia sp. B3]|uniref:ATP-binding protein n=1 Tax=Paraburkholderia sp. B3 TaxID=3134791 RepID=UPI00398256B0